MTFVTVTLSSEFSYGENTWFNTDAVLWRILG